ncbi:hypothetical protein [Gracilimonas mengyeensis]|nr:hypothetical protein [Gracilimonas mengyeensis]
MKTLVFSLFISFAWFQGFAQSVQISEVQQTADAGNQFELADASFTLERGAPSFVAGGSYSADINVASGLSIAALGTGNIQLYGTNGTVLQSRDYDFQPDDSSIEVYAKPDGGFVLRENIANFLFFDSFGEISNSISNSSQSTEGEAISELAADPMFETIVLYNPVIVRDGVEGSRASVVKPNGITQNIFNSQDRAIRFVEVSEDGQFIGVVTYLSGTDDIITLLDRNGNELNSFSLNQDISDFRVSKDGRYLTLRSDSRVAVFSVTSGERMGSTSIRSGSIYFADYVPEEATIIALSAERSGDFLNDVQFHAINLEERSLERKEYGLALGISDAVPLRLNRSNAGNYVLTGLSTTLALNVSW